MDKQGIAPVPEVSGQCVSCPTLLLLQSWAKSALPESGARPPSHGSIVFP